MTDLERFIECYKMAGINVNVCTFGSIKVINLNGSDVTSTKSELFGGYSSCESELHFTLEGSFIQQSFWTS
jgi:hypothetical protein